MDWQQLDMTIAGLQRHYQQGDFTPAELVAHLHKASANYSHKNIWIRLLSPQELSPYFNELNRHSLDELPLYGIPFAVKDNIDIAGIPTTAACPEFEYVPEKNAFVINELIKAGAIPIGKTNMDQFATGLVGTRSPAPWGPCQNAFDDAYISGGSSSGSAVTVSLGLASFSLGTDTAGSGRVPAALNNIVGHKPSKGLISTHGVVPACKSLDCVSIFALNADDAAEVLAHAAVYDADDPYSRANPFSNSARQKGMAANTPIIGIPKTSQLEFFGDSECEKCFQQTIKKWQAQGAHCIEIDFAPFLKAAALLYQGPWVAERYIATQPMISEQADAMHPVVRDIIQGGKNYNATDAFKAFYTLNALKKQTDIELAKVDFILTPTYGRQYTIDEVLADPIQLNSNLGYYTNYMNLLDYSAIALPAGKTERGIPFGISLVAQSFEDQRLFAWARYWQQHTNFPLGASNSRPVKNNTLDSSDMATYHDINTTDIVVCGAHLEGLPLNWQLVERGATLVSKTMSAAHYQLFALADGKRPAMVRVPSGGTAIEVEVWRMPTAQFGSFVSLIPAPLGIGKVELENGQYLSGFICDAYGLQHATDISHHGAWRAYLSSTN